MARLNSAADAGIPLGVPALDVRSLSKQFAEHRVLDDVSMTLRRGQVHVLLGQNGSGKSTLIKVLAGVYSPDGLASATVYGRKFDVGSALSARQAGLRFVHQDLGLIPQLSVAANMTLNQPTGSRYWTSGRQARAWAGRRLAGLEIDIDPARPVRELSSAERTMVAVARAVNADEMAPTVLVLDEVTATLTAPEVEVIGRVVRRLRDGGGTILYVTHHLLEALALADSATVLRDGRVVASEEAGRLTHERLVELIVGRPLDSVYPAAVPQPGTEPVIEIKGLRGSALRHLDLTLRPGEIVGITGVTGSGREEVADLVFGARPWTGGTITIGSDSYQSLSPRASVAAGMGMIPAERERHGIIPALVVRENLTLPRVSASRARWINERAERLETTGWLTALTVTPRDSEAPVKSLSGGNQQKVLLARWFRCKPAVLIIDEPTQGVDIGAKVVIYRQLAGIAARDVAVLFASTDHEELASLAHRVLVLRAGHVTAELSGRALTADAISRELLAIDSASPARAIENGGM
jgi:ribose transport system ATP-binding protein